MKKIFFFLILLCVTIAPSHAERYGGSIYNGTLNGYHSISYSSNSGITSCPDDGQGSSLARAHTSYTNMSASSTGIMRCQWWDNENPSSTANNNSVTWVNSDIYISVYAKDNGGSGLDTLSYSTSGASTNNWSINPTGNTYIPIIQYEDEGSHSLQVDIIDNVGLSYTETYGPYQIDKTRPDAPSLSSPSSSHPDSNTWYSNDYVSMNIVPNNEGPSPHENFWCFDSTDTCTPNVNNGTGTTMSVAKTDGIWYFRALTRDTGGDSDISSFIVKIDVTDPGSQTASQTAYPGATGWSDTNTSINLDVSDASGAADVSGIIDAYYKWSLTGESACTAGGGRVRFGGSAGQVTVSGTTNTSEITEDGSYRLTVCSIDGTDVGNTTESDFGPYSIDRNAPAAPTITVTNGLGNVGDGNWTTNASTSVVITESTTGNFNERVGPSPHTTLFCRSRTGPCTPTTASLGFGTETLLDGVRYFATQSTDTGGDSAITRYSIQIDTELPIHEAIDPNRLNWEDVSNLNIKLTSSDPIKDTSNSGVLRSGYIVNQSATSPFAADCTGGTSVPGIYTNFAEGTNYIHMCSIDVAGNRNISTTDTFGYYLVDLTDPVITDDYAARDGIWHNTSQTITLTSTDAHSGTRYVRYCLGAGCTPNTLIGSEVTSVGTDTVIRTITINPDVDTILRYQSEDYATRTSIISEIDVKIEDNIPTSIGTVNYLDARDNDTTPSNLQVSFTLGDTGGSEIERVQVQYRSAQTNSLGTYGAFGGWVDAPNGNFTGLSGNTYNTPYSFPFENGKAVQFRIQYYDEAGSQGIDFIGTKTLLMDNVIPDTSHDHPVARDGVWQNTAVTVNFSASDVDSGIPANGFKYCEGAGCDPQTGTNMSASRTFSPETDTIFRFNSIDRATNLSVLKEFTVQIEDNLPTGTISYRDGRDNNGKHGVTAGQSIVNRTVSYTANDTGGSMLENVTLQRQISDTNDAGGLVGNWTAWTDVPGHENTGLATNTVDRTYVQTFENGKAARFRLVVNDEATNDINALGYIDSTDVIRMDNVDPSITDTYVSDGIWVNTAQTIAFNFDDNDSGIVDTLSDASQNGSGRMYCIGILGSTCTPSVYLPGSLAFSPQATGPLGANSASTTPYDWEHTLRYTGTDRAGNDETIIGSIDILIEDELPESLLAYYDGWANDIDSNINRLVGYEATDAGGSLLEIVTLQSRTTSTNNNSSLNSFSGWSDIVNDSGLEVALFRGAYMQPFINRTAVQYRVRIEDEAGNIQYSYNVGGTIVHEENAATIPSNLYTLRMENEDATAIITNNDSNISANGWTNITAQGIDINFTDTGGSFLQSYTLQVSDVIDTSSNPTFSDLGTATSWANVVGHTNRAISGETDIATYTFTGVNKHAYMFRVMVTDISGNTSLWMESTDSPIKIDTDVPEASDVSSTTDRNLMATSAQNFLVDIGDNSGSPIVEANATFEDWSTDDAFLTSIDSSINDDNPGVANQLDVNHSIQDVDRDIEDAPAGYREYGYKVTRIEDEAGNIADIPTGIVTYTYRVYANSFITNIGTRELSNVASVTTSANIADGTTDTLVAEIFDSYGNGYVRADAIGREINFNFTIDTNLYLDQYIRSGAGSAEMRTSNTGGWHNFSDPWNDDFLKNLDYINTDYGQYEFDFRAYTPTENSYANTNSVSDPGANFTLGTFQFAVNHTDANYSAWDTGDQSLNNGALVDFVYSPLFTTAISGDIESYGFIEGANQDSDITIQKANSSEDPNVKSLVLEFGIGDRLASPLLGLQVFSPDMDVPEGLSTPTPLIYETFSLAAANSSAVFDIDSLLTMERGTTLDDIQNSYFSTHIEYTLNGKYIKYNADIIGKDNYFGNQTGGNTIQSGLKVLGQTHSGNQKDIIIDQEEKDLKILGDVYKASLKKDIVKNAFTIIRNEDSNWVFGGTNPDIINLGDFAEGVNDGKSLFNESVLYFGDDGTNARVDINASLTNARVSGQKTILAYGRDIYIESNIYYNNNDEDILGIIALSDEDGNGGNIYIDYDVTNIVGTLFAEKSLMSFDGVDELGGGVDQDILKHQLHIFGSVFSENTIGGSRSVDLACPYYVLDSDCDQDTAQKYDMNYLRRYFTYMNGTFIVPANDGKVIGGGLCDDLGACSGGQTNYARNITNTDSSIDTDSGKYAIHPVVIEYNPTGQTDPAPLFEAQ